jgi:hypothetical protein
VVNSSRGVTFPFQPDDPAWEAKVTAAAAKARAELTTEAQRHRDTEKRKAEDREGDWMP